MPEPKFWMVFNSGEQGRTPVKRHQSLAEATIESARLAVKYPGERLYVLEAVGYAVTGPAQDGGTFGPVEMHTV